MSPTVWKTVGYASMTSGRKAIRIRIFFRTGDESEYIDVYLPVNAVNKLLNNKISYIKVRAIVKMEEEHEGEELKTRISDLV